MWELQGLSRPVMGFLYLYVYIITSVLKTYMEIIQVNIMTSIRISNVSNKNKLTEDDLKRIQTCWSLSRLYAKVHTAIFLPFINIIY
jgi:hypothetical protein